MADVKPEETRPTRERILDAAAVVLREKGVAGTTTREIARAASCSEALLYKHFADKQQLFLAVLVERLPPAVTPDEPRAGTGDLAANLSGVVERLLAFFVQTFPMAVSIYGTPDLLAEHRTGVRSRGFGPEGPLIAVAAYLRGEQQAGRVRADADVDAAAAVLVGAAFHRAFLTTFDGLDAAADGGGFSRGIAASLLSGLRP